MTVAFPKNATVYLTNDSAKFSGLHMEEIRGLELFDTTYLEDMSDLFANCVNLLKVDISSFKTNNLKKTNRMFDNCKQLTYINLENFDTSNVKYMSNMFSNCPKLTEIKGIENMKTHSVDRGMDGMFKNDISLTELNLRSWTVNFSDKPDLFDGCSNLKKVYIGRNFDEALLKHWEFWGKYKDIEFLDGREKKELANLSEIIGSNDIAGIMFEETDDLSKYDSQILDGMAGMTITLEKIVRIGISQDIVLKLPKDSSNYFSKIVNSSKLQIITGLNLIDTSEVESMEYMFANCLSLKYIDISGFSTNSLINTKKMFYNFKK